MIPQELNHWWIEGKVRKSLIPNVHRDIFVPIKETLKRRQIKVMVGLRRVGKSTIIFQLMNHLLEQGVDPHRVWYCTFDDVSQQGKRLEEIFKEYGTITGLDYQKDQIYMFLDEIQKSKHWVDDIKIIYDNLKNVQTIATGSASLQILSEAKKNLAGRAIFFEVKPLSFKEYLVMKGIKVDIKRSLLHKEVLEKEFAKFLQRPFPELVGEEDVQFIKNYIRSSVLEPIILKDIPKEFNNVDILLLETLTNIFLGNPGQYLELDHLAQKLKRAKTTLYKAIFYLEFSFIIRRVLNYRPSITSSSRKLSRIYAYHPVLCLPYTVNQDKYVENLVFFELGTNHYWREKDKEIDFLKEFVPVEVKNKSQIDKSDTKWITYYLAKYSDKLKINKGYIITKDFEGKMGNIQMIPLWKFCLEGLPLTKRE